MSRENEQRCCEAVVRILELRHNAVRAYYLRDSPQNPGIDVTCTIGDQRYEIEHTLIEPFPENRSDLASFHHVFDKNFEQSFRGLLSERFRYDLWAEVYAFREMHRRRRNAARESIVDWVRFAVPQLPQLGKHPQIAIEAQPPDAPVRLILAYHLTTLHSGRLFVGRIAPGQPEKLGEERLLRALNDKAPKLDAARRQGSRTVLVLEIEGIANEDNLRPQIENIWQKIDYIPTEVFVASAWSDLAVQISPVICDGQLCRTAEPAITVWESEIPTTRQYERRTSLRTGLMEEPVLMTLDQNE